MPQQPRPEPNTARNYVTRPESIRALHFTEDTPEITGPAIATWTGGVYIFAGPRHYVELPGTYACATPGDYIVLQAGETFRIMKPETFHRLYTPEEESPRNT